MKTSFDFFIFAYSSTGYEKSHLLGVASVRNLLFFIQVFLPDSAIPMRKFSLHNNEGNKIISNKDKESRNVHCVLKLYPFGGLVSPIIQMKVDLSMEMLKLIQK
ncbi:MAG: hypothetical protein CVU40_16990 [Chloroflexi bacterium HGW-Chloroflexi-2]|nr:MAG: hypothetical protein CVU40_16990 [Chloroflexi bacterium HGW-Chloroflexi-2]